MSEPVEGDGLGYSSFFDPVFQRVVNHAPFQSLEHLACSGRSAKFVGFIADGERCLRLRLLCSDTQAITVVGSEVKVLPLEVLNITDA